MSRSFIRLLFITLIVSLGGFLFGFDASVISGVIRYIRPEFQLTDVSLGWVVSSPTFSAMFAMLVAGRISDIWGRKTVLMAVAALYLLSAVLSALAVSSAILVIARMIGGVAFGSALVIAPAYIAEIAPPKIRGRLVSVQQLNIVLGFSIAYFSNYILLKNAGGAGLITEDTVWRWMLGIEAVPAIAYLLLMFFVPRSPRWLYLQGRAEEAREIIRSLNSESAAKEEISRIEAAEDKEDGSSSLSRLWKPGIRYVFFIGLMLGIFQQITGINAIFFYATTIFEQTGIGADASFAQAVLVGIINVLFTILAMLLIDKLGRKPLLLAGLLGIAISMGITSRGFYNAEYRIDANDLQQIESVDPELLSGVTGVSFQSDVEFRNALTEALGEEQYLESEGELLSISIRSDALLILIGILGFVASFAFSLGPVMWVMLSELFPNKVRGIAISLIGFVNSFVSWLVQFVFPAELKILGSGTTYLIYALLAVAGLLIFIKILPETKGQSLEEIEERLIGES